MKSPLPKVLHPVLGKPMVQYVIDTTRRAGASEISVIIGFGKDILRQNLSGQQLQFVEQNQQLGTGHAVQCFAKDIPRPPEHLLVVCGDTPLLSEVTLKAMIDLHFLERPAATMITLDMANPGGYGRILRNAQGKVQSIREAKDCSEEEKNIREVNLAIYLFQGKALYDRLFKLSNTNRQQEYYLTDIIEMLTRDSLTVLAVKEHDEESTLGINSRLDLANVAGILRRRLLEQHMANGVAILDPTQTWVEPDVQIGAETVIWPGTVLTGKTRIGAGCEIGPHVKLHDVETGDHVRASFCSLETQIIPSETTVAPFSVRPSAKAS